MTLDLTAQACLPTDAASAVLVGRAWLPDVDGPAVVAVRGDTVVDITGVAPTVADLLNRDDAAALVSTAPGEPLGTVDALLAAADPRTRSADRPWPLAPVDLQAVKACGVTFAGSLLERVIEERAAGDPSRAAVLRAELADAIGADLLGIVPGSSAAARLKEALTGRGLWGPYLEVGLGPDAEVFTKAQPMSAVGTGADVGIHPRSAWNNPEAEVVLIADAGGRVVGATLGNDVNLRDVEGRSALLLGRAKDNNASCAIGPFIRLFDDAQGGTFGLDDLRQAKIHLTVRGADGFILEEIGSLATISRDPADLMAQTFDCHAYPDGAALFLGTPFAPVQDRGAPGAGFTHEIGDVVEIASPRLGCLVNRVDHADRIAPWRLGVGGLMRNLANRGLLKTQKGKER